MFTNIPISIDRMSEKIIVCRLKLPLSNPFIVGCLLEKAVFIDDINCVLFLQDDNKDNLITLSQTSIVTLAEPLQI